MSLLKNARDYFKKAGIEYRLRMYISSLMMCDFCDENDLNVKTSRIDELLMGAEKFNRATRIKPIDTEKWRKRYIDADVLASKELEFQHFHNDSCGVAPEEC